MFSKQLDFRPFRPPDTPQAIELLRRADRWHVQLDWLPAETWISTPDIIAVAGWHGDELAALMAASKPCNGTSWLRIIALGGNVSVHSTVRHLWDRLRAKLVGQGVRRVYILLSNEWPRRALEPLGFEHSEDVITMRREFTAGARISVPPSAPYLVRPVELSDIEPVLAVDRLAFGAEWRMTRADIHESWHKASLFTVAEIGEEVVGYQLCLPYETNAHLARLATRPEWQGKGIGSVLLRDVLQYFREQGVLAVTVNTQASNGVSQSLYGRYGFRGTGNDYPVLSIALGAGG